MPAAPTTKHRRALVEASVYVGQILSILFVLAVVVAVLALFGPVVE